MIHSDISDIFYTKSANFGNRKTREKPLKADVLRNHRTIASHGPLVTRAHEKDVPPPRSTLSRSQVRLGDEVKPGCLDFFPFLVFVRKQLYIFDIRSKQICIYIYIYTYIPIPL